MSLPARFLVAFARTLSVMGLYRDGHPSRERAVGRAFELLVELQEPDPEAEFIFAGGDVVFRRELLRDLKDWPWSERLSSIGIQRLAFTGPVTLPDFEVFLDEVMNRLSGLGSSTAERRQSRPTEIQYGVVRVRRGPEDEGEQAEDQTQDVGGDTPAFNLRDEADTIGWIHDELHQRDELHLLEVDAVVRSLSVVMHGDQQFLIPLLQIKQFDQYTTTHALNVSVLGMALAEFIGLPPKEVRAFGISGLLHDLGKTRIPEEILNKPGRLTESERDIMSRHPVEGARLILESDHHLDLAAVVAYEHHIRIDGGGYPSLSFPRACHQCSNLIHICDVYDALRTHRPYRDAWEHDAVVDYLMAGAGTEFDLELTDAFVKMMDRWLPRVAVMGSQDEALPIDSESAGEIQDP